MPSPKWQQQNSRSTVEGMKLLLPVIVAVVLLLLWSHLVHKDVRHNLQQYQVPPPSRFQLQATHAKWFGHPVYQLQNISKSTLNHITLRSWSEEAVPILYVGLRAPSRFSSLHPVSAAHLNLQPHESLWFAASVQSPYKLTVFWDEQNKIGYQVYTCNGP